MVVHALKLIMASYVPARLDTLETAVKPTSMNVWTILVKTMPLVSIWWVISSAYVLQDSLDNSATRP